MLHKLPHIGKTLLLVVVVFVWSKSGILYAASDSLPYKVYWLIKDRNFTPQKNQLVAIGKHDTKYVHDAKFIKIVGGVFGDHIKITNQQIWINDHLIGKFGYDCPAVGFSLDINLILTSPAYTEKKQNVL